MPSAYQVHTSTFYPWATARGVENLRLNTDVPKPTDIPAGHVLVNIKAASVQPRDLMIVSNDPVYPVSADKDLTPGADGAGVIEKLGDGGSEWKIGDRILLSPLSWEKWDYHSNEEMPGHLDLKTKGERHYQGTLREYGIYPTNELIRAPDYLTFEELAAIPASAGTAAHALFFCPRAIKGGQTVLTQGTGGVSCFVIQLASAIGATVIVTSSSSAKLAVAKSLGATHAINYLTHPSWETEVLNLTDGKGVDLVIEIGGSATIAQSVAATKQGGVVALVGFLSGKKESDIVLPVIFGGKTVYGVRSFTTEHVRRAVGVLEGKGVRPRVGRVFKWEEAGRVFEELVKGEGVGKVVVRVG
ncbi:NAD(P)-binding protein [Byssothecium circinans]|uniref:NAD(P)-binding protein n=1 Tax=Byssothecium circinans TaxID=147558 RepID=A0A6A5TFE1_9PLEO|nr:NAD(P)-binding protein [Byssothecium circinans]